MIESNAHAKGQKRRTLFGFSLFEIKKLLNPGF
jgi:hypothetical protein